MMKKTLRFLLSQANRTRSVFAAALALSTGMAWSQTTVTVGTGTATHAQIPLNTNYGYNYSQAIYLGSEITAASGFNGSVSKIRFYYAGGGTTNSDSWTIWMGNTTKTDFTGNADWVPLAQMTQVFSGTVTFPGAAGWMEITLNTPFPYTGGNLVIAVDENTASWGSGASWRYTTTSANRSIYYRNDSNDPNPTSPPSATGRVTGYPNLQLDLTPFPDCSGIPSPGTTNASTTTICASSATAVDLSIQNAYLSSGAITYQWQSFDGTSWNDIPGATGSTYSVSGLTATTQYQALVTCGADSTGTSTPVTINVNALPTVNVTPSSYALCSGGSAGLTAGGALNYSWAPSGGLNTTSGQIVTANPTAFTTYTVTGTDANNCSATATVVVSPISELPVTTGYTPTQFCTAGIPVTMDVASLVPAGISGSGTWEYQWMDNFGGVLQGWSNSSQYTTTAPVNGVYNYKFIMRSTSCPTEVSDTSRITVTIGFGADVDTLHVNCHNPTGALFLNDAYGQASWDTLYMYDFTSSTLIPTEATLSANASITGGRAVITSSATGVRGAFTLLNPNNVNPQNGTFDISFLMTADMPINIYGTGGADGITWSYGDDAVYSGTGPAHNGFGSKLRLSFDAADNGTENGNAKGIYLVYGWTATNSYGPGSSQVIAYSNNVNLWKLRTDVPVHISITPTGQFTLTVDGTVVFDHEQLPQAFVTADKSTWKHTFSAGTGGDAMRQAIDNLEIKYTSIDYGIMPGNSGTPPTTWQSEGDFTGLAPGLYDIWMGTPNDSTCRHMLGTFEVLNATPVVNLGNDTTICAGDAITLDAGNPGATYLWSGSNEITQTITVNSAGTYMVWIHDTADCPAFGVITVSESEIPSGDAIFASGSDLTYFFSVVNPQHTDTYDWNFGDGNTELNAPSTVMHTYSAYGTYPVTVTLSNDENCGTETVSTSVNVINVTGVENEDDLTGIRIYPNPASSFVTVTNDMGLTIDRISVYDVAGKLVHSSTGNNPETKLDVTSWNNGIYIVHVQTASGQAIHRLIVARP